MIRQTPRFNFIVIGSGFAGCLIAMILARRGNRVAIVDGGSHPRFTIGESSTPSANFLLRRISEQFDAPELLPLVQFGSWRQSYPEVLCGCKRGFSYFWHGRGDQFLATPDHRNELLVAANGSRSTADTQWYRPDTDRLFFEFAQSSGVLPFENASIHDIEHCYSGGWVIRMSQPHSSGHATLSGDFLIDASGSRATVLRSLGINTSSRELLTNTSAIYSHFDHCPLVDRWLRERDCRSVDFPYPPDDSAVHHLFHDGWLWQLRFDSERTSIGFVRHHPNHRTTSIEAPGMTSDRAPEMEWDKLLDQYPVLREIVGTARLSNFPGKIFRTRRLQRLASIGAGPDWAALPFTIGFVDPLHSTGIAHSLSGIERLSSILLTEPLINRSSALEHYSGCVISEIEHIDRLIAGCYHSMHDFRLFTAWTMLYFSAATTFERLHASGSAPASFLLADDPDFSQGIRESLGELDRLSQVSGATRDTEVTQSIGRIRARIGPFNQVGLFEPLISNMYHRTAVHEAAPQR